MARRKKRQASEQRPDLQPAHGWQFDLAQAVTISRSLEPGKVIARAEYLDASEMFQVEYRSGQGTATTAWFYGRELTAA